MKKKCPQSIEDIAARVLQSETDFGTAFREFLDVFYYSRRKKYRLEREPELLVGFLNDDGVADAYLAAIAVTLCQKYRLTTPHWALSKSRVAKVPFFSMNLPESKSWLLTESPPAFAERNLFISKDALSRV